MQSSPDISTPQTMYHNVYRVVLRQGEVWAIDPTRAQFGYYKPLCSWKSFQQRISKINRVIELSYIRHKVFHNFANYPVEIMVSRQAEQKGLVEISEEWFLARHSARLNVILQEPEVTFELTKHEFLEQLDSHVKRSLIGMCTPVEIAKRKEKVDAPLARNLANLPAEKSFKGSSISL
jgi:hypothetical protein